MRLDDLFEDEDYEPLWKTQLTKSAKDFIEVVWPKIKHWFDNCKIRQVELVSKIDFAKELDMFAGIDAWLLDTKKGIRGLASTVQAYNPNWKTAYLYPYNTFMIRRTVNSGNNTEFDKYRFALENDYITPYYKIHAYLNEAHTEVISAACGIVKDLVDYILNEYDYRIIPIHSGETAYSIKWSDFKDYYPIRRLIRRIKGTKIDKLWE